jgi:hypothetical protein
MSKRSADVSAWVSHFGARKLRVDEAIAEMGAAGLLGKSLRSGKRRAALRPF